MFHVFFSCKESQFPTSAFGRVWRFGAMRTSRVVWRCPCFGCETFSLLPWAKIWRLSMFDTFLSTLDDCAASSYSSSNQRNCLGVFGYVLKCLVSGSPKTKKNYKYISLKPVGLRGFPFARTFPFQAMLPLLQPIPPCMDYPQLPGRSSSPAWHRAFDPCGQLLVPSTSFDFSKLQNKATGSIMVIMIMWCENMRSSWAVGLFFFVLLVVSLCFVYSCSLVEVERVWLLAPVQKPGQCLRSSRTTGSATPSNIRRWNKVGHVVSDVAMDQNLWGTCQGWQATQR